MALEILTPRAAHKLMVSPVPERWWVRSSCVMFSSTQQTSPSRFPLYTVGGKRCLGLNVSALLFLSFVLPLQTIKSTF